MERMIYPRYTPKMVGFAQVKANFYKKMESESFDYLAMAMAVQIVTLAEQHELARKTWAVVCMDVKTVVKLKEAVCEALVKLGMKDVKAPKDNELISRTAGYYFTDDYGFWKANCQWKRPYRRAKPDDRGIWFANGFSLVFAGMREETKYLGSNFDGILSFETEGWNSEDFRRFWLYRIRSTGGMPKHFTRGTSHDKTWIGFELKEESKPVG
ncbi:hypothetical protein [Lacihabitans soyangensis]|uniref:Uncharacterized protein n=1 Tax=Lacihabitans soyangensis TaxID=869394 RepID=A0AAE3H6G5_9BACT|nr:hypothetical protein [Lacihabitans soyangensis]MCP9764954.1 hypothetical protein [Lacihabitans soyangensis]